VNHILVIMITYDDEYIVLVISLNFTNYKFVITLVIRVSTTIKSISITISPRLSILLSLITD